MDDKEVVYRLRCEKIVNETLSELKQIKGLIRKVVKKKPEDYTELDLSLLKLTAEAFLQKDLLDEIDDHNFLFLHSPDHKSELSFCDECEETEN